MSSSVFILNSNPSVLFAHYFLNFGKRMPGKTVMAIRVDQSGPLSAIFMFTFKEIANDKRGNYGVFLHENGFNKNIS